MAPPSVARPQVPTPDAQPPNADSLTPTEQPRTVVEGVAQRASPDALTPSRTPTMPVPVDVVAGSPPDDQSLTPDVRPRTVVDAVAGSIPSVGDLRPAEAIGAHIEGVAGRLGLDDELATLQNALAPAESAATRVAGTLTSGARSMASVVAGAQPPGMDATVEVGDAPSKVPVDASALSTRETPPKSQDVRRPEPQTVGQAAAATASTQRPVTPPTTTSPDQPASAPGLGGSSGQPATVGAAAAGASASDRPAETVGAGVAADAMTPPTAGATEPAPIPDVPAQSDDGRSAPASAPGPTPATDETTGEGGASGITTNTQTSIDVNLHGGRGDNGGGLSRSEARRIARRAGQRAGEEAAQDTENRVFSKLVDAADTLGDDQGPGAASG